MRYVLIWLLFLTSCSHDVVPKRTLLADKVASGVNMQHLLIDTDGFSITSYSRVQEPSFAANIYIEGDGFAWASRSRLSSNPTPRNPMALKLAALDDAKNVIYLARPCQYTSFEIDKLCESKFWSGSRFSKIVINSMDQAIDHIKRKYNITDINIIGYSGGAAIAAIIAARRSDVISIRTVAGNLDHDAVNSHHRVSILDDSLNPIDYASEISNIAQRHFSGMKDLVVPLFVAQRFARQSGDCVKVSVISDASHHAGWQEKWKYLLSQPLVCNDKTVSNNLFNLPNGN